MDNFVDPAITYSNSNFLFPWWKKNPREYSMTEAVNATWSKPISITLLSTIIQHITKSLLDAWGKTLPLWKSSLTHPIWSLIINKTFIWWSGPKNPQGVWIYYKGTIVHRSMSRGLKLGMNIHFCSPPSFPSFKLCGINAFGNWLWCLIGHHILVPSLLHNRTWERREVIRITISINMTRDRAVDKRGSNPSLLFLLLLKLRINLMQPLTRKIWKCRDSSINA